MENKLANAIHIYAYSDYNGIYVFGCKQIGDTCIGEYLGIETNEPLIMKFKDAIVVDDVVAVNGISKNIRIIQKLSTEDESVPDKLSIGDVIKVTYPDSDETFEYIIAQINSHSLALFELFQDSIDFNREFNPVIVDWYNLNTETICQVVPELDGSLVTKMKYKLKINKEVILQ